MKKLYLLGIALLCLTNLFSQGRKLVAIGSSTTGGAGAYPADSSWLRLLSFFYKDQLGLVDSVYAYGVGGYGCYKGMPTGYVPPPGRDGPDPHNNITKAVQQLQDLTVPGRGTIIVNYPSNNFEFMSMAEIMFCLQTIYDYAVAAGHKCYITTTQPRTNAQYGTSEMKLKLAIIKDSIINRFGQEHILNFWDGMYTPADTTILQKYSNNDNIHYNNAGHRVLFERVVAKDVFGFLASGPLPVTIEQFSGALNNNNVELKWTAHHNEPNSFFVVQRSSNGIAFESLKKVAVDNNGGGAKSYRYTDNSPLSGTAYYRLEVHEAARKYYSATVTVKLQQPELTIKRLYTAGVSQTLTLEIISPRQEMATLDIIGSNGARIKSLTRQLYRDKNIIHMPVGSLPAGNYFLRISSKGRSPVVQSFVK